MSEHPPGPNSSGLDLQLIQGDNAPSESTGQSRWPSLQGRYEPSMQIDEGLCEVAMQIAIPIFQRGSLNLGDRDTTLNYRMMARAHVRRVWCEQFLRKPVDTEVFMSTIREETELLLTQTRSEMERWMD